MEEREWNLGARSLLHRGRGQPRWLGRWGMRKVERHAGSVMEYPPVVQVLGASVPHDDASVSFLLFEAF